MCGCKIVGHLNSNTHAAYPRRLETLRVQGKMKRISISILETTQQMILSASETLWDSTSGQKVGLLSYTICKSIFVAK